MKFIHTGDLHIGKSVNEFSMLEEQKNILNQIIQIAMEKEVEAIVLAGDIYDRSVPPSEAVEVLDEFLTRLVDKKIKVLAISGNHDSPERLSFASSILKNQGVHIEGNFNGEIKKVIFQDEHGEIAFFLMPFIKLSSVRQYFNDDINTLQEAIHAIVDKMEMDCNTRNVMITHYFVTNAGIAPEQCDSESQIMVGGIDNIDAGCFKGFDYTALGHLHGPQRISQNHIYYAGSPLKYSFSEVHHNKGVNLVELKEKGSITVEKIPLTPIHNMRKIKGKLMELMKEENYSLADTNDYICATLTDEDELFDPIGTLRSVYPNIMQIVLDKNSNDIESDSKGAQNRSKTTMELYEEFYELVSRKELDSERRKIIIDIMKEAQG
jgi:exonuclease SbcD